MLLALMTSAAYDFYGTMSKAAQFQVRSLLVLAGIMIFFKIMIMLEKMFSDS